jgi:DNA-binding response OmpR family regulator
MADRSRILVIEDDDAIAASLQRVLEAEGHHVDRHATGESGLASARREGPDLALLDLGLPDLDGIEVCRRLRAAHPALKIVILTARTEEMDVVLGLDAGADDYLSKPFRLSELLARVRAHLRRAPADTAGPEHAAHALRVDRDSRRVWWGEAEIELRPKEYELVALLVEQQGHVLTRERIMREVWDENWWGSTKTLDMHITRVRQKLAKHSPTDPITTLRGVGYRFDAP